MRVLGIAFGIGLLFTSVLQAKTLTVVTTLPDLKFIAKEIGGDKIQAISLVRGYEDPHYVTPSLKLMSIVRQADLFVEIGLALELWTERVLDGAGNPHIRPGRPGYVLASKGVPRKEVPALLSRSQGDLHPYGNPHIWLDPLNVKIVAQNILEGLVRVAPKYRAYFRARKRQFTKKISEHLYGKRLVQLFGEQLLDKLLRKGRLITFLKERRLSIRLQRRLGVKRLIDLLGGWLKMAMKLWGKPIVFYHKTWVYFAERFGLKIRAYVEEKSGVPPSLAHRERLKKLIKRENIPVIGIASYYDPALCRILAQETGAKLVVLPTMTQGEKHIDTYFDLITTLLERLVQAYQQ